MPLKSVTLSNGRSNEYSDLESSYVIHLRMVLLLNY